MKLSLNWLKDFVDIDISPEILQEKLFSCGFEVEEIIYPGSEIKGVVAGKILSLNKHENADKLTVCQIDIASSVLQIVTGADNIKVADIVAVALDGATLAGGKTIKSGELRGVLSQGMLCSGQELGITDDNYQSASVNGILILDNIKPGECVKALLGLDDAIFDISITANRPDCQSILGMAREIAAVTGKAIKQPDLSFNALDAGAKSLQVEVQAPDLCPRYIAQRANNITIKKSPQWIRRRLLSAGIRPINNIVDITNYILIEMGQPMHAFDAKKIGEKIIVRRANDGESITTLDKSKITLNTSNLVICDTSKPVALAGIMGGEESGIEENTNSIIFEAAAFKRDNIRLSSKALGIKSDSSARFEKGVDAYSCQSAMDRALHLLQLTNSGEPQNVCVDIYLGKAQEVKLSTKISKINALLGIEISAESIKSILKSLGFATDIDGDRLNVTVPAYRSDIENYADLAEEVIRMYGYDKIEPTFFDKAKVTKGKKTKNQKFYDKIIDTLNACGANQTVSYSFVSPSDLEKLDDKSYQENIVKLINPLGEDLSVMRTTLLPSLLKIAAKNLNRKNLNFRLFEQASIYRAKKLPLTELPDELKRLCVVACGDNENFYTLKGILESLADAIGVSLKYEKLQLPYMHTYRCAKVLIGENEVGFIGQVSYETAEKFGIEKDIYAFDIDTEQIYNKSKDIVVYENIGKFPSIERDLAVLAGAQISWQQIKDTVISSGGEYLKSVELFDVYSGKGIESGKKSLAFSMVFNSTQKTLSVEEIDSQIAIILKALEKIDVRLRLN